MSLTPKDFDAIATLSCACLAEKDGRDVSVRAGADEAVDVFAHWIRDGVSGTLCFNGLMVLIANMAGALISSAEGAKHAHMTDEQWDEFFELIRAMRDRTRATVVKAK